LAAYIGKPSDVMISYSRKDKGFVRRLVDRLEAANISVWVDWQETEPGGEWNPEIEAGIKLTTAVLSIISYHSLASEMCNQEITWARANEKLIVPVIRCEMDTENLKRLDAVWTKAKWGAVARQNWEAQGRIDWVYLRRKKACNCGSETPESIQDDPICDEDDFEIGVQRVLRGILPIEDRRWLYSMISAADLWIKNERRADWLLRGQELQKALRWQATEANLAQNVRDFIEAARQYEVRDRFFKFAQRIGLVVTVLILLGIVGIWAALSIHRESVRQAVVKENPAVAIQSSGFTMQRYEVSIAQYQSCIDVDGCEGTNFAATNTGAKTSLPATNVTLVEAGQFCAWLGGRLPTIDEWMHAATGGTRAFPSGPKAPPKMCVRLGLDGPTPPGPVAVDDANYACGDTPEPESLRHMFGNAGEWTTSPAADKSRVQVAGWPWDLVFYSQRSSFSTTYPADPGKGFGSIGFRCVFPAK